MEFVFGKQDLADQARAQESCFLLTNGLGGYCSLSAGWSATRGDHALLMACLHAPTLRCNMVHRVGEVLEAAGRRVPLSTQDLAGRPAEEGWRQLVTFTAGAVPCWVYEAAGVRVTREVAMARGANTVAVRYTVENHSGAPCTLRLTPWFCFVPKGGRLTRRRAFTLGDHWLEAAGCGCTLPPMPGSSPSPPGSRASITARTPPTGAAPPACARPTTSWC